MTAAARPQRDGLSIGAVLAALRPDFPDVTISKIRFLESRGLVRPVRTGSGYRQFAAADVERLRFVLAAQRDHYLPLRVIKEQLDAADRGARPARPRLPRALVVVEGREDFPDATGTSAPAEPAGASLTRGDLIAAAEIDPALLTELEQFGVVRPDAAGLDDPDAVLVARTARAMTEFGIEPRHLRAFRASADREAGLLRQILAPMSHHRDSATRARADEIGRELMALSVTLHTLLVKAGLRPGSGA